MIEQSNNWPDRSRPEPMPEQAIGKMSQEQARRIDVSAKQNSDPWVHRSSGMRCKTCLWFVSKEPQALTVTVKSHELGRCRRHAPTMGGYPVVYMTDWCGDHRLDENKI
jgi:hypothetical protein